MIIAEPAENKPKGLGVYSQKTVCKRVVFFVANEFSNWYSKCLTTARTVWYNEGILQIQQDFDEIFGANS